jgi:hypothetical protein
MGTQIINILDQAEAFYRHHGFIAFNGPSRQLVLFLANGLGKYWERTT